VLGSAEVVRCGGSSIPDIITCIALREAGERHHDNAGGSRKISAVAAGHTMHVKEKHYEKVVEDFEQVHESYQKFYPAFMEGGSFIEAGLLLET
jgi:hypothetical protein